MTTDSISASAFRYSVVVPVFNEAENIGAFCAKALAELPPTYELLICYDFDGESTLPALAALPPDKKPPGLHLVKNDLGRGVRYAIEAGMRAATAPVVVVMMADLSDDFAIVDEIVRRCEAGADVVCPSRYMRGGRQIGGPWLKGMLSRCAGVSLYYLAGLPTHDATNSFRAYRKSFLDGQQIESTAGFCLAMELTVKCHWTGGRVEEVPASWWDRTAGESRFQLKKWLPLYLHWYFWAFKNQWRHPPQAGVSTSRPASWLWAIPVIAIGLSLAVLPHVIRYAETGDGTWIADGDDLGCYLAVGSQAFFNHPWEISDGVHVSSRVSSYYDWIQIVPPVLAAKAFQTGPQLITLFMRIFGGVTISLAVFVLLREHFRRARLGVPGIVVAGACLLFLADGGQLSGAPFYVELIHAAKIMFGHDAILRQPLPMLAPQWRVITPCMMLGWTLFALWALTRVFDRPTRARIIVAAGLMGALVYVYFYAWTALWLSLALLFMLDTVRRRAWGAVGIIGALIALPQVLARLVVSRSIEPGWRDRIETFLPIGHFREFLLPWVAIGLIAISAWYIFRCWGARRLLPIWCAGLCALVLLNNQLITGLQIQNFHWEFIAGPCATIFAGILLVQVLFKLLSRRGATIAHCTFVIIFVASSFYLRFQETTAGATANQYTNGYTQFVREEKTAAPFAPNAVIAGVPQFASYAIVLDNVRPLYSYTVQLSPFISNAEWFRRMALNEYLIGIDRQSFIDHSRRFLATGWGSWSRDPSALAAGVQEETADYDEITAAPLNACHALSIRYLALARDQSPPSAIASHCVRLRQDVSWSVWEIVN
ncbi:MAG: glycosyltransferase [Phycisphaerae bacterium]|nr:glycosyltransferase [Phycisphaerae bacterium]